VKLTFCTNSRIVPVMGEPAHIPASEFRDNINEFVNQICYQGKQFVIARHKKPVAAVIPLEDYELLKKLKKEKATKG
jgi:prevent-host-death family protein